MQSPEVRENISVVLVEPLNPGNIGSVARAMKNMGVNRLKLVNPCSRRNGECQKMAVRAYDLVEEALIFSNLEDALSEESMVVGTTSARGRSWKNRLWTPREIAPLIRRRATLQQVAMVFGPERRGLSEQQLALCQHLVCIPSSPDFPTLNLAHAVLVMAYELAALAPCDQPPPGTTLASGDTRRQMFEHMESVLIRIGFLSRSNPGHIMRSIQRFLGRAELTERDVQIVRGIFSQMDWYIRKGRHLDPESIQKP